MWQNGFFCRDHIFPYVFHETIVDSDGTNLSAYTINGTSPSDYKAMGNALLLTVPNVLSDEQSQSLINNLQSWIRNQKPEWSKIEFSIHKLYVTNHVYKIRWNKSSIKLMNEIFIQLKNQDFQVRPEMFSYGWEQENIGRKNWMFHGNG